jgi:hypothetical protein
MALTIPNLDRIQKVDPKLGEALKQVQSYANLNIKPAAGNRTPKPFLDPTSVKT